MSSAIASKRFDVKKSLVDAVLAGLIALIVFGPIVGVVLDGYKFNLEIERVAAIIGVVMLGRFLLSPRARACMCWRRITRVNCAGCYRC